MVQNSIDELYIRENPDFGHPTGINQNPIGIKRRLLDSFCIFLMQAVIALVYGAVWFADLFGGRK